MIVARDADPLGWRGDDNNAAAMPFLRSMAALYLSVPSSFAEDERLFSVAKRLLQNREALSPEIAEELILAHSNARRVPFEEEG